MLAWRSGHSNFADLQSFADSQPLGIVVGHKLKDLGSEILLVEDLLEPSLCQHIIQIAECCQFKPSSILAIAQKS